jgi:hypothetical protein
MMMRITFRVLAGLCVLSWLGCGPSTLAPVSSIDEQGQKDIRAGNGLTTTAFLNALTAGHDAIKALRTSTLSTATFSASGNAILNQALVDPNAQTTMGYLVGCALSQNQSVTWKNPTNGVTTTFSGALGICPMWNTGLPSATCLQQVSACVVARNNPPGYHVPISIRGQDRDTGYAFMLAGTVPDYTYVPVTQGPVWVQSVNPCTDGGSDPGRNCGWTLNDVLACKIGSQVTIKGVASDNSTQVLLRACKGVAACDNGANFQFSSELEGTAGWLIDGQENLSVVCPDDGNIAVMSAPMDSTSPISVQVSVSDATYPADEEQVFSYREGAFFGNIFDETALAPGLDIHFVAGKLTGVPKAPIAGSIYQHMFSCYAPNWLNGPAYSEERLCAVPDGGANCLATSVGECLMESGAVSGCAITDGSQLVGDGDYENCYDSSGNPWNVPVTTYLFDACSVVDDPVNCKWVP